MFTLAHLTDPHIAPLPRPTVRELAGKRILGYLNWLRSRKAIHDRGVLDAIVADIKAQAPDHIVAGGDLINLSLPQEYANARAWLESLGPPERVSVTPGNHDAYVRVERRDGLGRWATYMCPDGTLPEALAAGPDGFPFVRRFGAVALIGLCTGVPTPPFAAWGQLGDDQLEALGRILEALGNDGCFRIVSIHHPPLPGLTRRRRALREADRMRALLASAGAELVLYGHNHVHAVTIMPGNHGAIPVIGAPSASSCRGGSGRLARYNLFRIWRDKERWRCEMTGRGLRGHDGPVVELERRLLTG